MNLLKNIISMVSLKGLEYLLALILLPYLVRVLGAEKYGSIIFMQSVVQYFVICTDYGFNMITPRKIAITSAKNEQANIFSSTIICKSILCIVCISLFLLLYNLTNLLAFIDIKLFFAVFFNVIGNVIFPIWFFQGIEKMVYITIFNIAARIITVMVIFYCVSSPADYVFAALWQSMGSVISGAIALIYLFVKYNHLFIWPRYKTIKHNFIEGWDIFISTVAINAYTATNVVILRFFTNDIIVGYYGAANKIIESIKGLLNPVSLAVFPYVSKKVQDNKIKGLKFLNRLLKGYVLFGILMFVVLSFFAKDIVLLLLGNKYLESIILLKVMSVVPLLVAISNVFGTHTLLAFGYTKVYSKILICCACISVVSISVLANLFAGVGAAVTVSLTELYVVIFMYFVLNKLKLKVWRR